RGDHREPVIPVEHLYLRRTAVTLISGCSNSLRTGLRSDYPPSRGFPGAERQISPERMTNLPRPRDDEPRTRTCKGPRLPETPCRSAVPPRSLWLPEES